MKFKIPFLSRKASSNAQFSENNILARALYPLLQNNTVAFYNQDPSTYIDKGYAINPHARTVIDYIAENVSSIPFKVFEVVDEKSMAKYLRYKSMTDLERSESLKTKALQEVEDPMLNDIFEQPNESQSWKEFTYEAIAFKKLTGNNFIYGLAPMGFNEKLYTQLYNMPSQNVEIIEGTWMNPVKGYKLNIDSRVQMIEAQFVLHRKTWNPEADGTGKSVYGLSPMSSLVRSLQRSNESYNASLGMMQNGAPLGMLTPKDSSVPLSAEEMERAEAKFKEKYGGGKNKGKVFQSSIPMNWQTIGLSPADLQVLDSNLFDLRDFCRVYQLSSVLVSDNDKSTFNNVSEAEKRFWQNVAIPELVDLRGGLNRWLLPQWEESTGKKLFIDFDISGVGALQEDLQQLSARLLNEMEHGLLTGEEVLRRLEQPVGEGQHLNQYMIKSGLQYLQDQQQDNDNQE